MVKHELINPESLGKPRGYSNGVLAAPGRMLMIAGQIAWNSDQVLVSSEFSKQFHQALSNVKTVLFAAGGEVEDLCRLTIYVTTKAEYIAQIKEVGAAYRELLGRHFPAMALVEVADLLEEGAKVEIQGTAVIPDRGAAKEQG